MSSAIKPCHSMRDEPAQRRVASSHLQPPRRRITKSATKQSGFSLVTAIFVLVVLGALGGYMVSISGTQHYTTLHAFQGAKAYHAARSGIEWGVGDIMNDGSCVTDPTFGGASSSFTVEVSCELINGYSEGDQNYEIFQITSTAFTGSLGNPSYAARQITATVFKAL